MNVFSATCMPRPHTRLPDEIKLKYLVPICILHFPVAVHTTVPLHTTHYMSDSYRGTHYVSLLVAKSQV